MKILRNLAVTLGCFMLTAWLGWFFAWPLNKLTRGIIYDDGVVSALAMGFMVSLHRTSAAIVCGFLVTLLVHSRKPAYWGAALALLLLLLGPRHIHWVQAPRLWDREAIAAEFVFPSLACVAASLLTARRVARRESVEQPPQLAPQSS